jgi:hypothetical protein
MRTKILGIGATLLALAVFGCEAGVVVTTQGPSALAPVIVVIGPAVSGPAPFFAGVQSPIFDLRISASQTVDLHQVTIHMIDGSNLGGPMITVPRTDLVGQFGTTTIVAGTTRTFRLRPKFVWTTPPRSVAADITVKDSRGVAYGVTVESPWP